MKGKKIISAALLVSLLMKSEIALGQVTPLSKGATAPYAGLLLSPQDSAKIMSEKLAVPEQIQLEIKRALEESESRCKLKLETQKISLKEENLVTETRANLLFESNNQLGKQVKELQDNSRWTPLYVGSGVLGGFLVGALTTFLVTKYTD